MVAIITVKIMIAYKAKKITHKLYYMKENDGINLLVKYGWYIKYNPFLNVICLPL